MHQSILHRALTRLRRNARLGLPALALALTLGTTVVAEPQPPTDVKASEVGKPPIHTPRVNWNS